MTSAVLASIERIVGKIESPQSVQRLRKRCANWLKIWCSSLVGELLWMTARR
jgi:hypothetical protein